jgi:queuosine precursor transporter
MGDLAIYWRPLLAMVLLIVASNWLVQFPIELGAVLGIPVLITWGAATYPATFLVTDLTNRRHGPVVARQVIYVGFAVGIGLSAVFATPRIAVASGTAFLVAQLLDITVFNHLRRQSWWKAPLAGSLLGSVVDTAVFFSIAFAGTPVPWDLLAASDLVVKLIYAVVALIPYRVYMALVRPVWAEPAGARS